MLVSAMEGIWDSIMEPGSVLHSRPEDPASGRRFLSRGTWETHCQCLGDARIQSILSCADGPVFIVGDQFQIVGLNQEALGMLALSDPEEVLGWKLGEAFGCMNASSSPGGCGTAEGCGLCGALQTMTRSRSTGTTAQGEFSLAGIRNQDFVAENFRIKATPFTLQGNELTVVALRDLRPDRERDAFERLFFHDLRNSLQALETWRDGLAERVARCGLVTRKLLQNGTAPQSGHSPLEALSAQYGSCEIHAKRLLHLLDRTQETIASQQSLVLAERGEVEVHPVPLLPSEILLYLSDHFSAQAVTQDRLLEIQPTEAGLFTSDQSLLLRVLVNMVKNALEAAPPGGTVRVWHETREANPCFVVWNPGVIARDVQLQLFRRSFSTKGGVGRGLGTYGMKLFGERFLGGQVGFTTHAEEGTRFFIQLPRLPMSA
jgi:signal transduction histidine kinase